MPRPTRPDLAELAQSSYDLLIVGGGINGAGAAREAAQRGLKVLLVEAQDFAFGASSRSTKLAHGGLRYLETYDFALVGESLRERRVLAEVLAPHLVRPLPFFVPVYQGDKRPAWMIRAGLWLYDLLALKGHSLIQWHRWLGRSAALQAMPHLAASGLKGVAQYWDCQMNDARITLENILDAERLGAKALNYCTLKGVDVLEEGRVLARLHDDENGQEATVQARLLLVCAGPWTDAVFASIGQAGSAPKVKPTKGIHLITKPLNEAQALLVPARSDGRVFFVIPWLLEGKPASLIGTTDTDFKGDPSQVRAEDAEIDYLLQETARVLPGAQLTRGDVLSTYAGLRPLSAPPPARSGSNGVISREHHFWEEPGVLAVTGGKYTTYRSLCESLVDQAGRRLGAALPASRSAALPLPGAPKDAAGKVLLKTLGRSLAGEFSLAPETAALLVEHYGLLAQAVAALCIADPSLKDALSPGSPAILAMAAWSATYEHIVHLPDFYLRRSHLGLRLAPDHPGVERVASVIGGVLGWSPQRQREELELLKRTIAAGYR